MNTSGFASRALASLTPQFLLLPLVKANMLSLFRDGGSDGRMTKAKRSTTDEQKAARQVQREAGTQALLHHLEAGVQANSHAGLLLDRAL